jgi:hypothetical protein
MRPRISPHLRALKRLSAILMRAFSSFPIF